MSTERKTTYGKKEIGKERQRERRFVRANQVLKMIRKHPELHDIFNHEGIVEASRLPDAVQIDLASGSLTSVACLDFLFASDAVLSAKAKRALIKIGRATHTYNLAAKIWHPSAIGVRISSKPGDGSRMGNRLEAYKRLAFGRTQV